MKNKIRSRVAGLLGATLIAMIPGLSVATPMASAAIGGSVTCDAYSANFKVVGVWIDSSNNAHDGWASWTAVPGQPWTASFSKGNVSESYRAHVGCGGTTQNWAQTSYSGWVTGNHNFICHVSSSPAQRVCFS